jgi:hypothetical protein
MTLVGCVPSPALRPLTPAGRGIVAVRGGH